jgi:outer membrane protein assembly factor BamB
MTDQPPRRNRMRWWTLGIVVFAIVASITYIRTTDRIDVAMRNPFSYMVAMVGLPVLALWFLFFSGLRWRTRFVTLGLALLILAAIGGSVQIDGFSGEMVPQFRWRWRPAHDYELSEARAAEGESSRIVLRGGARRDFSQFLGPNGRNAVDGIRLARDWSKQQPRLLWRQSIGAGWSAFATAGNYAVTQEQRGELELVTCYEIQTGRLCWTHEDQARFSETLGSDGPRATPTIVDGRVYAMGATGILNCLDGATGKRIWSHDVLSDVQHKNLVWGKSCSPLVFEDVVVVSLGDTAAPSLAAYTGDSGRLLWRAGHDKASYATPIYTTLAEREQIVVVNQTSVSAHDPTYGDVIWEYPWPGDFAKCSQPVPIGDDRVFISAGYGIGCALLEVTPAGGSLSVKELWADKRRMKTRFTNVSVRDGHVYGLDDGILGCLELATGAQKWKGGRYGHGQVLLVDDLLLVVTEVGEVVLVEAVPSGHHELGRFAAITGKTWNGPALSGQYLLVRNAQEAACYELPLDGPPLELSQRVR